MLPDKAAWKRPIRRHIQEVKSWNKKRKNCSPQTHAYTVEEIAASLHIGRSSAYTLVRKGYFKSVRIGTAIRISRKSFDDWLDQLEL